VIETLAVVACGLLLVAVAFQVALAAGAPWAAAAYGGRAALPDGRLPGRYRVASVVTAVVLVAVGWVLLLRGGVVGSASGHPAVAGACWALAVLFGLNTLGNLAGRHPVERWGMGAVTAALTVLCVLLALGPRVA
jgi:hypothetical protein